MRLIRFCGICGTIFVSGCDSLPENAVTPEQLQANTIYYDEGSWMVGTYLRTVDIGDGEVTFLFESSTGDFFHLQWQGDNLYFFANTFTYLYPAPDGSSYREDTYATQEDLDKVQEADRATYFETPTDTYATGGGISAEPIGAGGYALTYEGRGVQDVAAWGLNEDGIYTYVSGVDLLPTAYQTRSSVGLSGEQGDMISLVSSP